MIGSIGGSQQNSLLQQWKQTLQAADTDQDGSLSLDEFTQMAQGLQAKAAGQTTPASATSATDPAAMFAKLDKNSDGKLSQSELAPQQPHHHHHHAKLGGSAMSMLMGLQGDQSSAGSGVDDLLQTVATTLIGNSDTNGDGSLTLQEFTGGSANSTASGAASKAFSSADTNGDGILTSTELAGSMKTSLDQRLNDAGTRAYGQLMSVFNDIARQASSAAKTASTNAVSVTA